jgi:hypothetical protein
MFHKKRTRPSVSILIRLGLILILLLTMAPVAGAAPGGGKGKGHGGPVQLGPVEPPRVSPQPQHPVASPSGKKPKSAAPQTAQAQVAAPQTADAQAVTPQATAALAAADHLYDPRTMKLLLIAADGKETDYAALKAFLDQLGVPYDTLLAAQTPLVSSMLWDGVNQGYYQGILLTTGNLSYDAGGGNWVSAFDDTEWSALWDYEARFGVRQVTSYNAPFGYPDNYGLNLVTYQDTTASPLTATLTAAGQQVYPYLNASNPVTIKNAWVYLATVITPAETTPLLVTANGYAVASIHTYPDGRQNLAITAGNSPYLYTPHSLLLSYGTLNWVTKGQFLGERHVYMSPQVDDLLIDSDIWSTTALTDTTGITYRINATDFAALINWQNLVRANYALTTCVTVQPNSTTGKDTYIAYSNKDNNYGNAAALMTDSEQANPIRALIQFDLSSIPNNATVISATLGLYLSKNSGSQTDVVEAHRLTRNWTEGTGGKNTGATWNRYNGVSAWTTAGGDYDASIAGSFVASGTGWKTITLTTLAQAWVNGTYANQGVILLSPPKSGNNEKQYNSSDASNASQRPKLAVCYRPPSGNNNTAAFMLEHAFNGEGASGIYSQDTLTPAVLQNQTAFRWVNHTYTHLNLDAPTTYDQALTELSQNDNVAVNQFHFTNYFKDAMVQPDISGLSNPDFQRAANDFGIRYLIDNTSQPGWNNPSPNAGFYSTDQPSLLIVPRRPSNLFYNLTTPAEFVSEYNCYYGPKATCAGGKWKYWDHNLTYAEILDKESDMWLQYLLAWDMDPLMFHQANLKAYDGTHSLLGDLVDATLAKYNRMVNLPILSEAEHNIGLRMANRMAYNTSGVTATYIPCTSLTLSATRAVQVPVTGVAYGTTRESYGNQTISYIQLQANQPVSVAVPGCQ